MLLGRFANTLVAIAVLLWPPADASAQTDHDASTDARFAHGATELAAGRFDDALATFQGVLGQRRAAGDRGGEGHALVRIAWTLSALGRTSEAIDTAQRAVTTCAGGVDPRCEARAHSAMGEIRFRVGEIASGREHLTKAAAKWEAIGEPRGQADALTEMGWTYWVTGELATAIQYYERALPLWQRAGDKAGEGYALNNVGFVFSSRGDNAKALEYFQHAARLRRDGDDTAGEAQTYANMGWAYWNLGEYQKTMDVCLEAVRLSYLPGRIGQTLPANQKSTRAWALDTLGLALGSLGDFSQGLTRHREALELRRATDDRQGLGQTLNNIGIAHFNLGQYVLAHEYFTQALDASRGAGDKRREALALNNLGLHFGQQKHYVRALEYFREALQLRRAIGDRRAEAQTRLNIGRTEALRGVDTAAREHLIAARDLFQAVGDRGSEATALLFLASHDAGHGRLTDASTSADAALTLAESLRTRVASQELRGSFLAARQHYYELYIDVLMRLDRREPGRGHLARALEMSERARARSLLESLVEAQADIRQGIEPELLAREREVRRRLDARERARMVILNGRHTAEQARAAEQELEAVLREYRDLQTEIRARSPRYAAITQPEPLTVHDIQTSVLDDRSLLLEYRLGEARSYLFAATRTSIRGYTLPGRARIEASARRLHRLLTQPPRRTEKLQLETAVADLSAMLLGPVASQLGRKRLLIVADGILHYVPFAVLSVPQGAQRGCPADAVYCPLIVDHEVVSLPSASAVSVIRAEQQRRPRASKTLAIFSDPVFDAADPRVRSASSGAARGSRFDRLPFSRREALTIAALAPPERTLNAIDFDASREAVTDPSVADYRFVHFATHGVVDSQHPELSGLVLSLVDRTGRAREGFLRVHELYNLDLGADLVVLSACRTALGTEIKGEGIVGLVRGFMYAGSPRVVSSLWDVRDAATAELMTELYRRMLSDGFTAAAALRAAQLSMWRSGQYQAPFYWGAFILQGEWR